MCATPMEQLLNSCRSPRRKFDAQIDLLLPLVRDDRFAELGRNLFVLPRIFPASHEIHFRSRDREDEVRRRAGIAAIEPARKGVREECSDRNSSCGGHIIIAGVVAALRSQYLAPPTIAVAAIALGFAAAQFQAWWAAAPIIGRLVDRHGRPTPTLAALQALRDKHVG